jgi:hypothetical protein
MSMLRLLFTIEMRRRNLPEPALVVADQVHEIFVVVVVSGPGESHLTAQTRSVHLYLPDTTVLALALAHSPASRLTSPSSSSPNSTQTRLSPCN